MRMQYGKKLHAHVFFCQIACPCNWAFNFMKHAILVSWVSFNSSGLHECCPMSWPLTSKYIYTVLWVKDQTDFSFVFFWNFLCINKKVVHFEGNASIIPIIFLSASYGPCTATILSPFTKSKNLFYWNTLLYKCTLLISIFRQKGELDIYLVVLIFLNKHTW